MSNPGMDQTYISELQENNRLLRALLPTHPSMQQRIVEGHTQKMIDSLNLQSEWAELYGECVSPTQASKIIGKSVPCIHKWAAEGKIIKSKTGGILIRSLAAYIQSGISQGNQVSIIRRPVRSKKLRPQK